MQSLPELWSLCYRCYNKGIVFHMLHFHVEPLYWRQSWNRLLLAFVLISRPQQLMTRSTQTEVVAATTSIREKVRSKRGVSRCTPLARTHKLVKIVKINTIKCTWNGAERVTHWAEWPKGVTIWMTDQWVDGVVLFDGYSLSRNIIYTWFITKAGQFVWYNMRTNQINILDSLTWWSLRQLNYHNCIVNGKISYR